MAGRLSVTPEVGGVWSDLSITLSGWPPFEPVELEATLRVDPDHRLRAWATFFTDSAGGADLSDQAPVNGSYHTADANGLVWSMVPDGDWEFPGMSPLQAPRPFRQDSLHPYRIEFTATACGQRATASAERLVLADGVRVVQVDDPSLAACLFLPPGEGPHPALIQFGGSGGGIQERRAAQYAAHGWATLALGYFRVPGAPVPATLDRVPLEYFRTAVAWLRARPDLLTERIAVSGTSRGGELALLLGSIYPDLSPIIAWVPSSVLWGTHAQPGGDPRGLGPSWTVSGRGLPFVRPVAEPGDFKLRDGVSTHSQAFLRNVSRVSDLSTVEIPAERIGGPALLIGGDDDALWPSGWFVRQIGQRLKDSAFPHPFETVVLPDAGHGVSFENEPTTFLALGADTSQQDRNALTPAVTDTFHMGGTAKGNAEAGSLLRALVWDFLDRHAPRAHSRGPATRIT